MKILTHKPVDPNKPLSHREYNIAKAIAEQDLGYKQIADHFNVTTRTIRAHAEAIHRYFGVNSRLGLALEWSKYRSEIQDWISYLAWHRRNRCKQ